jgi:hypothetical protein
MICAMALLANKDICISQYFVVDHWRREPSFSILGAKFHVPVPVCFLNGRKTGDIFQKMSDVTYFMKGYFYVGWWFILIPTFSLNLVSDKT